MSETKEVTPEFVQYIKERDAAVEESKKAQAELRETQCKLYDAIQTIEKLEKVKHCFFFWKITMPVFIRTNLHCIQRGRECLKNEDRYADIWAHRVVLEV